jgi:hypothetical protein
LRNAWDHLDISAARVVDGVLQLAPNQGLTTRRAFSGPIDITVVARTEKNNIRLHAHKGGEIIVNWEGKAGELRVHRPDAANGDLGSVAVSQQVPLAPNVWHSLRWRITDKGMDVTVNGQVVFAEADKKYDLSARRPVRVSAVDSVVDVKSFIVKALP